MADVDPIFLVPDWGGINACSGDAYSCECSNCDYYRDQYLSEIAMEAAYERHLENLGWQEAEYERIRENNCGLVVI